MKEYLSRDDVTHHAAGDIGQAEIPPGVAVRQPLVVEAQRVQDRRVQVVHVDLVLHGLVAEVVGGAVGEAGFDAGPCQPLREAGRVVVAPAAGNGGPRNYGNAFLPPVYQGTAVGKAGGPASELVVRNQATGTDRGTFELMLQLNAEQRRRTPGDAELDAVIDSYELAGRMQANAPDVLDLSGESEETLSLYGINREPTDTYGRQCLMARRMVEAGVRYVQVTYGDNSANPAWDQHTNMPRHADHAVKVDKPISGLLADLKRRGLLQDTLVWWGGEFGRTPYSQGSGNGRDHNPSGFTHWLAGAGVKPGFAYGATDDFGHQAVQDKVHMHDLHATILHLLGLDHERLTYRYAGRNFRLTDVHGNVVKAIMT